MAFTITDVLNQWASYGVFSYLFPFLIIFAVVFAVLQKSQILGDPTKVKNVSGINAVIAIAIGFLALLNDAVPTFFATLFPKFGIILAVGLVLLILLAFAGGSAQVGWVGWVLGVGVLVWAFSQWNYIFDSGFDMAQFLQDYFWGLILLAGVAFLIYWIVKEHK